MFRGVRTLICISAGIFIWAGPCTLAARSQNAPAFGSFKKVLVIFSEARDLPGNVMMEQALRAQMTAGSTNRIEFYTESMDAGRFPDPSHYRLFRDYIKNKYSGQNLDLVMMFMARDFPPAEDLPWASLGRIPVVFVAVNELDVPVPASDNPLTGIFQHFDLKGTIKFIFQLQPETRHVVVIGGTSTADEACLAKINQIASTVDGVVFDFWTNRPLPVIYETAHNLPPDTVIWFTSFQRDIFGETIYGSQVMRVLAPEANVPIYVMGKSILGGGAIGGNIIDFERLGQNAGEMACRVLDGVPPAKIPIVYQSNGVPMVDWRVLQHWNIKPSRLPQNCQVEYRPQTIWDNHWQLILLVAFAFVAQALTIAALLVQRSRQLRAEAEILKQRTELAHVARVSTMGQLASALTHELNQPLGAILRNAEAAEIYLQQEHPNLSEVRAILTDIRRDDKRAGNVIDRMRSLFKRQKLTSGTLHLPDLVEDTVAMARPDAVSRQVRLKVEIAPDLPPAQGDRVHVQQVLLNLILNGMDAMDTVPKSRRQLVIGVSESKSGNLQVTVSDAGTGISPDNAEHVFEPFFTTKSKGMGMGLAISKTIIEAHGGEIWLRSNAVDGTIFTFLLPRAGQEKVNLGDLPAVS